MRYLYLQDFHIKGKNGCNRLGNYFDDILLKWDEILKIAKDNKCEAILDGGDFLSTANPSYIILDQIADRIEKSGLVMYSLLGNHTMRFAHVENSQYVGLMHLQKRSKSFRPISELEIYGVELIPVEYNYEIENVLKEEGISFKSTDEWKIGIVHALVTPKKFFDEVAHLTPEQFKTNGDLILVAHYHHPYEIKVGETTFLNIGCTGRNSITEHEIKPSIAILDTEKRSYEVIELKSAKPGMEVFNLEKHELEKNIKKELNNSMDVLIKSIESTNFQGMSVIGMIQNIAKKNNTDKDVVNLIENKIGELQDETMS